MTAQQLKNEARNFKANNVITVDMSEAIDCFIDRLPVEFSSEIEAKAAQAQFNNLIVTA